jgi:hypothetical protein
MQGLSAEALQTPYTVTWRDKKFTVEPPDTWMMRFLHHFERGQFTPALEQCLGAQQYQEYMFADPAPKFTETQAFVNQIGSHFKVDMGEWSASTGS